MGSCVVKQSKQILTNNPVRKKDRSLYREKYIIEYKPDLEAQYQVNQKKILNSPTVNLSLNSLYNHRKMMLQAQFSTVLEQSLLIVD